MRRFKNSGDKQTALEHLYKSKTAMDKARNLARFHAQVRRLSPTNTLCIILDRIIS